MKSSPASAVESPAAGPRSYRFRSSWVLGGAALLYFAIAVWIQFAAGAYHTDFGHYPDEPSHVINALMVRDYVRDGFPAPPLEYARTYYLHYPKVTIGIWPPFSYFLSAVWLLVACANQPAMLAFVAIQSALLAATLFWYGRRLFPAPAAFGLGIVLLTMPLIMFGTVRVMVDILVSLMEFWSVICLIRFIRSGRAAHGALFGFVTAAAMLTKGNGNCLPLAALLLILFTRTWRVMKTRGMLLAIVTVVFLGLPWQWFTMSLLQKTDLVLKVTPAFVLERLSGYLHILIHQNGFAWCLLAVVGLAEVLYTAWNRREPVPSESLLTQAGAAALLIAVVCFHSIAPIPGPDERYMTAAVPPLLLLGALGIRRIGGWVRIPGVSPAIPAGVFSLVALGALGWTWEFPKLRDRGFRAAASALSRPGTTSEAVFVCSDSDGEGALIVEMALRDRRRPDRFVLRGTKILSRNPWDPQGYQPRIQSEAELQQYLDSVPVDAVLVDLGKTMWDQDRNLVLTTLKHDSSEWAPDPGLAAGQIDAGPLVIYRRLHPLNPDGKKNIVMPPPYGIGIDLFLK